MVYGRAGSNLREKRCFLLLLNFLCLRNRVQEPKGLGRCACISGFGYIDPRILCFVKSYGSLKSHAILSFFDRICSNRSPAAEAMHGCSYIFHSLVFSPGRASSSSGQSVSLLIWYSDLDKPNSNSNSNSNSNRNIKSYTHSQNIRSYKMSASSLPQYAERNIHT